MGSDHSYHPRHLPFAAIIKHKSTRKRRHFESDLQPFHITVKYCTIVQPIRLHHLHRCTSKTLLIVDICVTQVV